MQTQDKAWYAKKLIHLDQLFEFTQAIPTENKEWQNLMNKLIIQHDHA